MKRRLSSCLTWIAAAGALCLLGCKSGPSANPDGVDEDPTAILDAPIPKRQRPDPSAASAPEAMMLLPQTPTDPAIELDGSADDWKDVKSRRFHTRASVEDGLQYWSGAKDASMRVSVNADEGFLYFLIDVTDDTVLETPMGERPRDGVVLWLRDPGLDAIGRALPGNLKLDEYVDAETAILFLPNGRVEPWTKDQLDFNTVMQHATTMTKSGYTIEVALKLEVFEEISSIPLPEIAFRVELLDGDDSDRPGVQTRLSTTPDRADDSPRFAIYTAGGLLPHAEVGAPPRRLNAIGRWKIEEGRWNFISFEVVPRLWATFDDQEAVDATLRASDSLRDVCNEAQKDMQLVEAYQTRGGKFRTALVMCGQRAVRGKCSASSESSLLLVTMRPDGEEWAVDNVIDVFDKPLPQCTLDAAGAEELYGHFSLFPLDVLDPSVWAIGWTRTLDERDLVEEVYGITMISTKFRVPHLGTTITRSRKMTPAERAIANSSVYLTYVNDDDNVDICQIEDVIEQACDGFDRGCVTYEHGRTILTHIQMWSVKKRRFERYELTKHKGCSAQFDFAGARGYLFLQVKGRIGLLPSPTSNAGSDTEKLDLF